MYGEEAGLVSGGTPQVAAPALGEAVTDDRYTASEDGSTMLIVIDKKSHCNSQTLHYSRSQEEHNKNELMEKLL